MGSAGFGGFGLLRGAVEAAVGVAYCGGLPFESGVWNGSSGGLDGGVGLLCGARSTITLAWGDETLTHATPRPPLFTRLLCASIAADTHIWPPNCGYSEYDAGREKRLAIMLNSKSIVLE